MLDDDDLDETLLISFSLETRITRVLGKTVVPSKLTIRTDVNPDEDMSEQELSTVMAKIRFWFDNIIPRTIAFCYDNDDAMGMLINEEGKNRSDNILMITPGDPTDDLLATLFQAKVTALSGNRISFALMEVKSDNLMGLSYVFIGDGLKLLPSMENWIGKRSYFKEPWWNRDDASTLDVVPPPDADLNKKPGWAFSLDTVQSPKTESVVLRPEFKPTIIDGGKTK